MNSHIQYPQQLDQEAEQPQLLGADLIDDPAALEMLSGNVNVLRSSGELDTGWQVAMLYPGKEGDVRAMVVKEGTDNEGTPIAMSKSVEISKLLSFNQQEATANAEHSISPYADVSPRLAAILQPIEAETSKYEMDKSMFDYMLDRTDEPPATRQPVYGEKKYDRRTVTDKSERDAFLTVSEARIKDTQIDEIISHFTDGAPNVKIPQIMRTNGELRLALGTYLHHKVQELSKHPHRMPPRIARNGEKMANSAGYDTRFTSQEYAVALAIAMLDGTFKAEHEDENFYDPTTGEGGGQHRTAAKEILMSSEDLEYKQTPY